MKKRVLGLLLVAVMSISMLAGCSMDSGSSGSSGGDASASSDEGSGEYKVGITFSDLSNPVWAELVKEAERYAKEKDIKVTYVDAQSDATKQVTQIENFVQSGMDAIIVCAVESNAVADVTKKAQEAGVYVVGYTQTLENCDAQYLVDPYNTGYACGERAAKWINENYGDEEVVEWALMDLPEFPEIIERANGIKAGIEENAENAKLVATASALTSEEGVKNAETFLQAHPDIKAICCIGGGGSVGGNEGIKSAGITDYESVGLFGIDATENEILNIINKDPQKSSVSLGGGKEHGRTLVDITADLLEGKEVEKDQYMPIEIIDASNAQEYFDTIYGK